MESFVLSVTVPTALLRIKLKHFAILLLVVKSKCRVLIFRFSLYCFGIGLFLKSGKCGNSTVVGPLHMKETYVFAYLEQYFDSFLPNMCW